MVGVRNIWSCALEENVEAITELISGGVSVNCKNSYGETALHIAARHGLLEVAQVLLAGGANVNSRDWESGWTPLHRSLYFGHIRVSLLLLQAGALLDDGRDETSTKSGSSSSSSSSRKPRSRSRSESIGQATQHLPDHDGNTPLDLLSLELRPQLIEARDKEEGGDVYSFGKADFFLGYDSLGAVDVVRPRRIEALANLQVVRVAASRYHSCAVTLSGEMFTWGHGRGGRLGHGNEDVCMLPTLVQGLRKQKVVEVAASDTHSAALTMDGALYTWGRDRFGQLGHGSGSTGRLVPKRVEGLRKMRVVAVATGTEHTAAVTSSGMCYTWGRNNHGQLGFDGVSQTNTPRVVSCGGASRGSGGTRGHVTQVSASPRSTVVITRAVDRGSGLARVNEVYQWGQGTVQPSRVNFNAVMNDAGSPSRWQTHDSRVNIVQLAAAKNHNLALSSHGQVFAWGFGADNLGLDPRETRTARGPKLVAAMLPENCGGNAIYVAASDRHSCVVTDTGDLFTWGSAGEGVGALGHGKSSWQPVAKRVTSLKKVALVAAAPDHTLVLLHSSCPALPHAESLGHTSGKRINDRRSNSVCSVDFHEGSENGEDIDSDLECLGDEDDEGNRRDSENATASADFRAGLSEPLTLKQQCEVVLAREVDLRNVCSILAYADALDAPALVKHCAEFVTANLDGILVLGRPGDRDCLLEASGALACTMLGTSVGKTRRTSSVAEVTANATAAIIHEEDEEGLNREVMATALARAEMRAETPSVKTAARAVRSLKKKIARITELTIMQDSGKDLTEDQVVRVKQKDRMAAELNSLESRLERAKLAQLARAQRLTVESKGAETNPSINPERRLFIDDAPTDGRDCTTVSGDHDRKPSAEFVRQEQLLTPTLDLSQEKPQIKGQQGRQCEACGVTCADAKMYSDHLRGKRHRAQVTKLEKQLHDSARASSHGQAERPCAWANVSQPGPAVASSPTASSTPSVTLEAKRAVDNGNNLSSPESKLASSQAQCKPNRSAVNSRVGSMRLAVEQQQQAATIAIARDTRGAQPSSQPTPVMMTMLRSTPPSSSRHESSQCAQMQITSSPGSYSLNDFIAPRRTKKTSRKKGVDETSEGRRERVWVVDGAISAEDVDSGVVEKGEREPGESFGMGGPMRSRKSFSEIIAEEERDKKERDEYGDNVWFVSRKPRSTSFETIIQQQRREEKAAEEKKTREVEDQMEQEMLRLVLEMSMNDVQPNQPSSRPHGKPAKGGWKRTAVANREAGTGTRRQPRGGTKNGAAYKNSAGSTTVPPGHATELCGPTPVAGGAANTRRENSRRGASGPNRRPKHSQSGAHGEIRSGQVAEHRPRKEARFGTSV